MYKLTKNVKHRIVIGATIGSLLGGAYTVCVKNALNFSEGKNATFPFILDDIDTYGVTTQEYNIPQLKGIGSGLTVSVPQKEYLPKDDISAINPVNLSLYSPWTKINNWEYDNQYFRYEYHCNFSDNQISEKEIKEQIELFKKYQIEDIINNTEKLSREEVTKDSVTSEELENTYPSSKLTIKTIDYNDKKITKQSQEENKVEIQMFLASLLTGCYLGGLLGAVSPPDELLQDKSDVKEEKKKTKSRLLTKKKNNH